MPQGSRYKGAIEGGCRWLSFLSGRTAIDSGEGTLQHTRDLDQIILKHSFVFRIYLKSHCGRKLQVLATGDLSAPAVQSHYSPSREAISPC